MDRSAVIRQESDRFGSVLAVTDPAARVPTCPDWSAAELAWHLAHVHRFWAEVLTRPVLTDEEMEQLEQSMPQPPGDVAEVLRQREAATDALLEQLAAHPDDQEHVWSWWEPDQTVGFTRRMQTYEATIHRIDAELTAGVEVSPIADDVAAGAVQHCVDVMWGWQPPWGTWAPLAVVALEATDTDERWLVEVGHWTGTGPESGNDFDWPRAVAAPEGSEPVATVRAPVAQLARWAWGRRGTVETSGADHAVAALDRLITHGIQ